ncbi:MAG TPA: Xaa-Pro peptidase family protein, partial [Puia sp.]|nr:Xaa-Pro peptidase family protein [Puia sp.]
FHLVPALCLVVPGGHTNLIVADNELGQPSLENAAFEITPYESYRFEQAPDPSAEILKKIEDFVLKNRLTVARIGIESKSIPYRIIKPLEEKFPGIQWIGVDEPLAKLRMIKDEDEIEAIRKAAALADIGQEAVLKYARPGMTELEVFALVHRDMETSAGCRVPLMSDLSTGVGTNGGSGMPTNRIIKKGNPLLSDFQPCLQGYWGDSCSTVIIGDEPTADQKKTFSLVKETLYIGIEAVRPGIQAKEVDRLMRNHLGNYPHHSGHSVGTAYHEEPRITPYNDTVLEAGMIIALEPALYQPAYGMRLEHLMVVTDSGSELLTKFKHRLEQ